MGNTHRRAEVEYSRHVSFDIASDHPFNDLLSDVCRGTEGHGRAMGVGGALMWQHHKPDGALRTKLWHCGCNVLRGTKVGACSSSSPQVD